MSTEIDKEYQELVEQNKIAIKEIVQKTINGFITIRRWIDEKSFNKLTLVRLIDSIIKSNKLDEDILEDLEDAINATISMRELVCSSEMFDTIYYLNKIFDDNATFEKFEKIDPKYKCVDMVTFTCSGASSIAMYILSLIRWYVEEVARIEDSLPYKDLDDLLNIPRTESARLLFPIVWNIKNSGLEDISNKPAFRFILKKISAVDLLAIALVDNLICRGILDTCKDPHEEMIALVGNMVRLILLGSNIPSEQVKVDNTIINYAYLKLSRDSNINRRILGKLKILLSLVYDPESVVLFDRTMPFFTHMDELVKMAPGYELEIKVLYLKYLSHIARFGYLGLIIPEKYFKSLYLFDTSYEYQKNIVDVVYCDPLVKLAEMANSIKNLVTCVNNGFDSENNHYFNAHEYYEKTKMKKFKDSSRLEGIDL